LIVEISVASQLKVEQVSFHVVEGADDALVEGPDGGKPCRLVERVSQILHQQHLQLPDQGRPPAHKVVAADTCLGLVHEGEAEQEVEDHEPQNKQRNAQKFDNDDLLVAVLTVDHLLELLLHLESVVRLQPPSPLLPDQLAL
jgi:hypothetical protein